MFDIKNPNQLEYENQIVQITVLGGIRIDGLDRMRVTLKIRTPEAEQIAVRHNLDLYNDTQVEKLIRKTATKLEIGSSVIEASINELIEELEKYRLAELENKSEKIKTKSLTEEEYNESIKLLSTKELLSTTSELIGKSGVVGEETNRLIMYLIFSSRKREQPLHIISLGSSGTGKTHLQESIGNLIPDEEKIEITTLSENAFYYFGQQELKHKVILIEDLDGILQALYPLRELQSKKKISKTIAFKNTKGETKTVHLTVEGPVCVAGCTTQESIYEDNANRSFLIYLDESEQQDQRIMDYQRKLSAGKVNIDQQLKARNLLQNVQRILEPVKVVNPFAEILQLPKEVLKPRRTNAHYLQFIEIVTYYHQFQREKKVDEETGEEYIESTIEDIRCTNELLKEVLIRKSDLLTYKQRMNLEKLKSYLKEKQLKYFENKTLRDCLNLSKTMARKYITAWMETDEVEQIRNPEQQTYQYFINPVKNYQNIETAVNRLFTEIEQKLTEHRTPSEHPDKVTTKKVKNQKVKSSENLVPENKAED